MDYQQLAATLLQQVGGQSNISDYTNCATRLRFTLKDSAKFDKDSIEKNKGVLGTVIAGGQHQVIIGPNVAHVTSELAKLMDANPSKFDEDEGKLEKATKSRLKFDSMLDTISGIFTPILPAITGAAMVKVLLIILTMAGILTKESQTYAVLSFVGDTPFYFLPVMLAYPAAKKFNLNPMIGLMLALILVHPTYSALVSAGNPVTIYGFFPVTLANYASTVIPVLLVIYIAGHIERLADRYSPEFIKFFMKPLITILVMVPVAFCAVGPIGTFLGNYLGGALTILQVNAPWFLPVFFGALAPIVIMFGMHYVVTIPLVITAITTNGFDMIGPGFLVANIAQGAAALAVALIVKKGDFKALASSTGITALLGVTEPAIYGVNLRLKKPFVAAVIGGLAGGLVCGLAGVKRITFGPTGLTTIAIFIDPNNTNNFLFAIAGIIVSFIVAFGLTFYLIKRQPETLKGVE